MNFTRIKIQPRSGYPSGLWQCARRPARDADADADAGAGAGAGAGEVSITTLARPEKDSQAVPL
jgi:hypothetical protein